MTVLFYSPDACQMHHPNPGHPEAAVRMTTVINAVKAADLPHVRWQEAGACDMSAYAAAHSADYIAHIQDIIPVAGYNFLDDETVACPDTLRALRAATGAVLDAVDKVIEDDSTQAFCAIRPPGHHAHRDHGGGFCFFNHIAIAAYAALKNPAIRRVALLDFDVHHADGTTDIIGGQENILLCSTYQEELDGAPTAALPANVLAQGFAAGTDGAAVIDYWEKVLLPAVASFKPDLVLISAGYDAHRDDPLADLNLTTQAFGRLMRLIRHTTQQCGHERLIAVLEGGYDPKALADCVVESLKALTP